VHAGFWWEKLREGDHLEYPHVEGRIILKWIFRQWDGEGWTGLMWLRIGTGGEHVGQIYLYLYLSEVYILYHVPFLQWAFLDKTDKL
jgi:hypothetical protein